MRKYAVVAAVACSCAFASTADANHLVHWRKDWKPSTYQRHHPKHAHTTKSPVVPAPATKAYKPTGLKYVVGQDQGDCAVPGFNIVGWLKAHHANVLKFGTVPHWAALKAGVSCIEQARAAGYPIYLNIDWPTSDSIGQVVAFVKQAMTEFGGSYFAVGLGNEQDIKGVSIQSYFGMWQAVAPLVHQLDPGAILTTDFSPWAAQKLEQLVAMHPVDLGAVGFHCYDTIHVKWAPPTNGLAVVPALAAAMDAYHVPLWCSEMAPNVTGAEKHMVKQSDAVYDAMLQKIEVESPNLQMVSWYHWPALGAS